jgi:GT2 family glycosyltransferase
MTVIAQPAASVVVVNWNGLRFLDRCLGAVLAQQLEGGFEVVLVDNGSTDGSVEHVRANHPAVRVVESRRNLGFSAGADLGIAASRGRHIVLLDNDTEVRPGWLSALVAAAENDQGVGAVDCKVLFREPAGTINSAGLMMVPDGRTIGRGFGESDTGQYDQPAEVFGACTTASLFRRRMLEEVGVLDSAFFAYLDDTDLSWRMRLAGWRILYEPKAVVEHVSNGTGGRASDFLLFRVNRNRLFLLVKNAPTGRVLQEVALLRVDAPHRRLRLRLRVALSLLWHLPGLLVSRRRVRRNRRVSDAEVARWFYPVERLREHWNATATASTSDEHFLYSAF